MKSPCASHLSKKKIYENNYQLPLIVPKNNFYSVKV